MDTTAPPRITVRNSLNINKIFRKLGESKVADKHLQAKVYEVAKEKYLWYYETSYKSLVRQIIQHLENGFDGALQGGVTIALQDPISGRFHSIHENWDPLTKRYQQRKARYFLNQSGAANAYNDAVDAFNNAKADARKKHKRVPKFKPAAKKTFGASTADKYWVFKRNLADALSREHGFSEEAATVTLDSKVVRRGGVLVTGKDKATIRYSVGLKLGKLSSPFDDMVRKPFITGDAAKSRVWFDEFGGSGNEAIRVLAILEGSSRMKRPFIVDLSAQMGRLVRRSLKI